MSVSVSECLYAFCLILDADPLSLGESGLWEMKMESALHERSIKMPKRTQVRLYPFCGEAEGEAADGKTGDAICEYVTFYDGGRLERDQIVFGPNFKPIIEPKYEYLEVCSRFLCITKNIASLRH